MQVTGPFLFVGYARRLEMTRELFDDIWFDTGDMRASDSDGYLRLSGRTKDVIIRGGENIPVAYVENALYENPKIASVAVVGMPDPRLQERACACVVLRPGVDGFTFEEMKASWREGHRQAVLAGTARGHGRTALDGERKDPEVPAPRRSTGSS